MEVSCSLVLLIHEILVFFILTGAMRRVPCSVAGHYIQFRLMHGSCFILSLMVMSTALSLTLAAYTGNAGKYSTLDGQ